MVNTLDRNGVVWTHKSQTILWSWECELGNVIQVSSGGYRWRAFWYDSKGRLGVDCITGFQATLVEAMAAVERHALSQVVAALGVNAGA